MIKRILQYIKDLYNKYRIGAEDHSNSNTLPLPNDFTQMDYIKVVVDSVQQKTFEPMPSDLIMGIQGNLIAEIKYALDNGTGKTHKLTLIEQAFQKYENALNNQ